MILADKIIELRKKNGWSQEELADKLGVSRQAVSKWEGAQAVPDMNRVLKLSEIFGVSTDFLLKDELELSTAVPAELQESSEGGSRTFTELLAHANLSSPFDEACLKTVCEAAKKWLDEFDMTGME